MANPFFVNIFNSSAGFDHYFIGPKTDRFILHSLEKLSFDEYLYRLLRECGYERVVFTKLSGNQENALNYRIVVYDSFSYFSYVQPKLFEKVDIKDANALNAFLSDAKDCCLNVGNLNTQQGQSLRTKRKKPKVPQHAIGKFESDLIVDATFTTQFVNYILSALRSEKVKTAIVLPIEMFKMRKLTIEIRVLDGITALREGDARPNILLFTMETIDDLRYLSPFNKTLLTLSEESCDKEELRKKNAGKLMEAFRIGQDEIINLLLRKKLVEKKPGFEKLAISMAEPLAEKIYEHFTCGEESQKSSPFLNILPKNISREDFINRLDGVLDRKIDELVAYTENLKPRRYIKVERNGLELERMGAQYKTSSQSSLEEVMEELNALTGLANVKEELEEIFDYTQEYDAAEGLEIFIFQGNPGTGKTTVARLMGRAFKAIGLLSKGHIVEVRRKDLVVEHVGGSAPKTLAKCREALGGVLFFDEAYSLISERDNEIFADDFSPEVYTELMNFATDHKNEFCLICAGYTNKMTKFVDANEGMASRAKYIDFPDYSAEELLDILLRMADAEGFTPNDGYEAEAKKAINTMLYLKTKGFGNARDMKKFLGDTKRSMAKRMRALRGSRASDEEIKRQKFIMTAEDIPKQYRRTDIDEEYATASEALKNLIGLHSVKEKIRTLVNTTKLQLADSATDAQKPDPGRYMFLGNPGTGKTEVARLFGKLLHSIGLLSKGHLVEVNREDLVGEFIGQTAARTLIKCNEALGGVLFVDEAYRLMPQGDYHGGEDFGKEALETIMTFMENNRHGICVIFAGYPDKMESLRKANPGTLSRIGKNNFICFEDYSVEELLEILRLMIKGQGKEADDEYYRAVESIFKDWIAHKEEDYGNARDVRSLVEDSVQQAANRLMSLYEDPKDIPKKEYNLLVRADLEANYLSRLFREDAVKQKPFEPLPKEALAALTKGKRGIAFDAADSEGFHARVSEALLFIRTAGAVGEGTGTGFLISPDGLALTCAHVVNGASAITARMRIEGRAGGRDSEHVCEVLHAVPGLDLALIRLKGDNFPFMPIASAERRIVRDEEFLLIGYPFGSDDDYTSYNGSVASSADQTDEYGPKCFINGEAKAGNSGSPLLSKKDGAVIGVLLGSKLHRGENLTEEMNMMRPIKCFWEYFTKSHNNGAAAQDAAIPQEETK